MGYFSNKKKRKYLFFQVLDFGFLFLQTKLQSLHHLLQLLVLLLFALKNSLNLEKPKQNNNALLEK